MLIRLQLCDMAPNEQRSTPITSTSQISPHSPACSLTTPSKAFFKLQPAAAHRLHVTTIAYIQAHVDKEQWNDNCFAPSFSAYNLEKIIHLGFALTEKQWHLKKNIFTVQKVKKNPVPVGGEREKNKKERREEGKKQKVCPSMDFRGITPAASFFPHSLLPSSLPHPFVC